MKRFLIAAAAVGLIAGITAATVNAAPANTEERGYISVDASANTELTPDVVEINIAVKLPTQNHFKKLHRKIKKFPIKFMLF